ncbi:MAG: hypothetical protein FD180_3246 [Planctomycetota bacterium]|nr:MAG: hypothetical protein FD180_3246 [Planctomycetota bacterium]
MVAAEVDAGLLALGGVFRDALALDRRAEIEIRKEVRDGGAAEIAAFEKSGTSALEVEIVGDRAGDQGVEGGVVELFPPLGDVAGFGGAAGELGGGVDLGGFVVRAYGAAR